MINKKMWIAIIVIAGLIIGGIIAILVSTGGDKISADQSFGVAGTNYTADLDFKVTIDDGTSEVRSDQRIVYKISVGYGDKNVTDVDEMNKAVKATLKKHNLQNANPNNVRLVVLGYLGTGRGGNQTNPNWIIKAPNLSTYTKFNYGLSVDYEVPVNAPKGTIAQNKVLGRVYAYLTAWPGYGIPGTIGTANPNFLIPVGDATDEDTYISSNSTPTPSAISPSPSVSPSSSPSVTPSPTLTPTPSVLSVEISPKNPGAELAGARYVASGSVINFQAYARNSEGSMNEVTKDPHTQWKVTTTSEGSSQDTIGTIDSKGHFKAVSWSTAGIAGTQPPCGKVSFIYDSKSAETQTFCIMSTGNFGA